MDEADLIILTSPVYVYHVTAPMKNLWIIRGTAGWYTARDRRCSTSRRCVFHRRRSRYEKHQQRYAGQSVFLGRAKSL